MEKKLLLADVTKNRNEVEKRKIQKRFNRMSEDSCLLFSYLPEEIWGLIGDKVTDSNVIDNLLIASPVFRNILRPRRVEYLFPQVWKVIGVEFENLVENLSRVFTLRLVCKSWCKGVDEFYENRSESWHNRMQWDRETGGELWSYLEKMHGWNASVAFHLSDYVPDRDVVAFIDHFDPTHFNSSNQRNPIIGRRIQICYNNGNRVPGIYSMLSKYGHHFWFCSLDLNAHRRNLVSCYSELLETLQLLPNLKALKVTYRDTFDYGHEGMVKLKQHFSNEEILQLEREIASHPLPKLHNLEFLSVTNFPAPCFNVLVSVNNHVSMLEVERNYVQDGHDIYNFPMKNLKQLSMKYLYKTELDNLHKPEVNWALEKLYLNFEPCTFISLSEIFALLESKWASTLKNVAIHFPPIRIPEPVIGARTNKIINDGSHTILNLPKVQRFKLIAQEVFSLDFILPMNRLQFLEVGIYSTSQDEDSEEKLRLIENRQKVQFVGYFQRFEKSNIWNLIPNLKNFTLHHIELELHEEDFRDLPSNTYEYCRSEGKTSASDDQIKRSAKENLWFWRSECDIEEFHDCETYCDNRLRNLGNTYKLTI